MIAGCHFEKHGPGSGGDEDEGRVVHPENGSGTPWHAWWVCRDVAGGTVGGLGIACVRLGFWIKTGLLALLGLRDTASCCESIRFEDTSFGEVENGERYTVS